jgi:hypothetical protein
MTKLAAYAVVVVLLSSCSKGPGGIEARLSIAASSVVDLSSDLPKDSKVLHLVMSSAHLIAVTQKDKQLWLIRYSPSGTKQAEFLVPSPSESFVVRDVAADDLGNIALLSHSANETTIEILDQSGDVRRKLSLKRDAQKVALTLRRVFAISDTEIIRADDGSVVTVLPQKDSYQFFATPNAKLVAISETFPFMYTYDLATSAQKLYNLDAPEIMAAFGKSMQSKVLNTRPVIAGAAVDADGTIYLAISPNNFDLSILKLDELSHVTATFDARLPAAHEDRSAPMGVLGGIDCLGDQLLVYSPFEKRIAFYSAPVNHVFVP